MTIALWVVTGLLAVIFAAAGLAKATTPKASLHKKGMTYVEDFSDGQIKAIGIAEVLGAVGLIVPTFISSIPPGSFQLQPSLWLSRWQARW